MLLTEIIQRVQGKPLAVALQDKIFGPLGMHNTQSQIYGTELLTDSASLHLPSSAGGFTRGVLRPPISGKDGIVSTVGNLYGMKVPASLKADGAFMIENNPVTDLRLLPALDGDKIIALDFIEFGTDERVYRTDMPTDAEPAPPVGRYRYGEVDAVGDVSVQDDAAACARSIGSSAYWLEPLAPELWLVTTREPMAPHGGIIETGADQSPFSSGRTRRLPFRYEPQPGV